MRQPRRNAVGGPCVRHIDDPDVLGDVVRLRGVYREERQRGALSGGVMKSRGERLQLGDVDWIQFLACAVRARQVIAVEDGNAAALFATLINNRLFAFITEAQWAEARRLAQAHRDDRMQGDAAFVEACVEVARRCGEDPFRVAKLERPNLTREQWEQMQWTP